MSMFKSAPVEKPAPTTFGGKMIAKLPEEANKTRALMFFGISALFLMLAFFNILSIVTPIIEQFKEDNKVKHQEIKETAKALKKEIREQVETEATRTSDL